MGNSFIKQFEISSYHLNPGAKARLTTITNFFQEMAYHHANQLGFGYDDMHKKDSMWVLSRMRIRMNQYPVWNDQVWVETWHRGMERLFGLRDFKVMDLSGQLIGMASSAWLILDSKTRRPVRADESALDKSKGEESVFKSKLEKIQLPDEMASLSSRKVLYSDLDIMGHVNNVKYMEWCIDAAFNEDTENKEIRELEINFMNEALMGEEIELRGAGTPGDAPADRAGNAPVGGTYFVAFRKSDGKEIFRSRIIIC